MPEENELTKAEDIPSAGGIIGECCECEVAVTEEIYIRSDEGENELICRDCFNANHSDPEDGIEKTLGAGVPLGYPDSVNETHAGEPGIYKIMDEIQDDDDNYQLQLHTEDLKDIHYLIEHINSATDKEIKRLKYDKESEAFSEWKTIRKTVSSNGINAEITGMRKLCERLVKTAESKQKELFPESDDTILRKGKQSSDSGESEWPDESTDDGVNNDNAAEESADNI